MKKLLVVLLALGSLSSFALTKNEVLDYEKAVRTMSSTDKAISVGLNGVQLITSCGLAPVRVVVNAILNTIPVLSLGSNGGALYYNNHFQSNPVSSKELLGQPLLTIFGGAATGLVVDIATMVSNFAASGSITDEEYTDAFQLVKEAYSSTDMVIKNSFGKHSACSNNWTRLGVLLGYELNDFGTNIDRDKETIKFDRYGDQYISSIERMLKKSINDPYRSALFSGEAEASIHIENLKIIDFRVPLLDHKKFSYEGYDLYDYRYLVEIEIDGQNLNCELHDTFNNIFLTDCEGELNLPNNKRMFTQHYSQSIERVESNKVHALIHLSGYKRIY